ncbi:hypothetical protein L7F22_015066 [Adiantum nelumboides]|nr:hypothetical protein [Adiantum nelumboides]
MHVWGAQYTSSRSTHTHYDHLTRGGAMEARWPRPASSPSSSPSSSSAPLLLELAEELWFCSSVVSFPCFSFSLPSFPLNSGPDTSTLLAQLMFSTTRRHPHPPSSPSRPSLQQQQSFQFSDRWDSSSCSEDWDSPPCPGDSNDTCKDQSFRPFLSLDDVDEENHHSEEEDLHSALTDCKHENACPDHRETEVACDDEDAEHGIMIFKNDQLEGGGCKEDLVVPASVSIRTETEDAFAGLYDVAVLLKDQRCRGFEGDNKGGIKNKGVLDIVLPKDLSKMADRKLVQINKNGKDLPSSSHVDGCRNVDATCTVSYKGSLKHGNAKGNDSLLLSLGPAYRQVMHELSSTEQDKMKERLKVWAQTVASSLHSKAAVQMRQPHKE